MANNSNFDSEYQKLNPEQRQAVDTIEGPVMVIAGAGTGKTQTIALRIGKILTETQTNPSNILCLTFTENAAINMRQRLISLIGPAGYGIRICTFHAFCNSVIQDHPEFFLFSQKESVSLDDIKKIQIIRRLIDDLPASSPLKSFNSPYFFQKDIIRCLSDLKKENILPDHFAKLINFASSFVGRSSPVLSQLSAIRATPKAAAQITSIITDLIAQTDIHVLYSSRLKLFLNLYSQNQITLSQLKQQVRDFIGQTQANLAKQNDLLIIYRGYQSALRVQNLFDYDDMILWVLTAFSQHSELLAEYQEKYQYLLVDEFQDTNSSQFEILNLLTQSNPNPNLFVVGDDDQSIYRFQGASVENVYHFYQKYHHHLKVVVLKNNYRSHRLILSASESVINNNFDRITKYIENLDKSLVSVQTYDPDPINLTVCQSNQEEVYNVAQKIKSLVSAGANPSQIAVLFRNNNDIADFLPAFNQLNIKYLLSDSTDILQTIEIQQLITLLNFIVNPADDVALAKVLSFNFIGISAFSLYRLFHSAYRQNISLSQLISSPKSSAKLINFSRRVAKSRKDMANLPLDRQFNTIIRRFKFLPYLLSHQRLDVLKQLNVFYSLIKSRLQSETTYTLAQFATELSLLLDNQLSLNSRPLLADLDQSIRLMTVHKAKGLEFEHVFLIRVLSGKWDGASSRNLVKLPLGIVKYDITQMATDKDLEEDRRLFYVALTRAKKQIYLSYSQYNDSAKEQLPSAFIHEIDPKFIQKTVTSPQTETQSLLTQFTPVLAPIRAPDLASYLQNYLSTQYVFNITHLNAYLKCPFCFFFKTILRLPSAKTKSLALGTAVHGALAYLFKVFKNDNRLISLETFLDIFQSNLVSQHLPNSEFESTLTKGKEILKNYYLHYQSEFNGRCFTEHDFRFSHVHLGDIPITGKIDKIDLLNSNHVNVVDFKTGRPDHKYQELSPDGDYFRQLVFYKILAENTHGFPYKVDQGIIDFIEPLRTGQYKRFVHHITLEDVDKLTQLIITTFQKIQNLEFPVSSTCQDPERLHYLAEKYFS